MTPARRLTPVPFTRVTISDAFWAPRIETNRAVTLPSQYGQLQETGRLAAFSLSWKPGDEPVPHIFWDSDIAKWIEAASYSLATHPDPALDAQLDQVISLIAGAQQPDGYLNIYYTAVEPDKRWSNLRDCHELYCAGHLMEAAAAHAQATGKRTLLDVLARYADYIGTVFGTGPEQKRGYCGHEEIELALVKLYHVTGERRYLDLASYFVDERGREPHYFHQEAIARGEDPGQYWARSYDYCQAGTPVREQTQVTGHAVRAMYLYSAMADLAGELGDEALLGACRRLWDDLTLAKMHITGGIGPSAHNEGFTAAYDLPNESAYCETCAAIGLVFWAHRLLQFGAERRYADVMELALYNGTISGVSLDGSRFFYVNPLESSGGHHRQDWFGCACCPPNIARMIASVGEYAYSTSAGAAWVHLYIQGSAALEVDGREITLTQETRYPWEGDVALSVSVPEPTEFSLCLRIPGWCREASLTIDGEPVDVAAHTEGGYLRIRRTWTGAEAIRLSLSMPVEFMQAHPLVKADTGCVALQRGPVVYCVEGADNPGLLHTLTLDPAGPVEARWQPELLGGVVTLTGQARIGSAEGWEGSLYRQGAAPLAPVTFTAIPYCVWDNREPGAMRVWLQACRS